MIRWTLSLSIDKWRSRSVDFDNLIPFQMFYIFTLIISFSIIFYYNHFATYRQNNKYLPFSMINECWFRYEISNDDN